MKRAIASIVALLAMVANAGPFGYEMGQKIEGAPDEEQAADGRSYRFVEDVHNPFSTIAVYYTAQTGVCEIRAFIAIDADSDSYGTQHRERADWLAEQIEAKYGKPTNTFDVLSPGSIWSESKYWLMGIRKNERYYTYFWTDPPYPNEIESISVQVMFGLVQLGYQFSNFSQCVSDAENQLQNTL